MFLMVVMALAVVACNGVTTTEAPTTGVPTTVAPTTVAPTTQAPTTVAPTTQAPTTVAPTTEAPTTVEQDTIAPVINGVDDVTIYLNETFNPMAGVTATDNKDGDITSSITVAGVVDTTKEGTNFLVYTVYDAAGNKKQESRYVYVTIDPSLIGDEIVQNGDFSLGNAVWNVTDGEGSSSTFDVVDGVGVLKVVTPSWNPWAPRLESNVIEFENGVTYEITFDAKADAVRSIHVQVGELLSGAPWFDDYKPMQPQIFDLSTDWQTFTFKFTMNKDTGPGQLLFENGTVTGGVGTANLATTIYYDNVVIVESTPDADTQAPVISGATDLTLETGAVYDPLADVSAYDVVDGEITLDSTHYVSNVDTSVPGEYEVTYTVSDVAGNTATITIYVTVVDLVFTNTNDITDGTFTTTAEIVAEVQDEFSGWADITDPEIWYQYTAGWDGAAATFTVVDGKAVIEVTAPGNNDWGLMLKQKGITLVPGETYKLSFSASSTVARDIVAKVSDHYFATFALGTEEATYSFIFTYEKDSTTTERVLFLFGQMTNYAASTVTIDNVELGILEQDNLVVNGDFTNNGWNVWSQNWDQGDGIPTVTSGIVSEQYVVTTDLLGNANWAIQLFQEGLVLENGKTYRVTFDAMADTVREINAKVIADGEFFGTIALTNTMATYTYEFLYSGASTLNGKLDFELGVIGASVAGTVTFDNIKFEEVESGVVVVNSDQVVNGTFDQVVGWTTWAQDWDPVAGVAISQVDGQLLVDVTALGGANWGVQLFQDNVALVEGATYTMSFVAKSSVARDINFVLIAGSEFRKTFDLTTEFAVYTYTFVYTGTASLGKLDFELGNISAASVPALVTFESISFYRTFNPFEEDPVVPTEESWVAYGTMTLEETETEKTITYVAGDVNWWDSNVQGLLPSFDGTNNAIVFTITGTAGHEYLFKFEGGGQFRQIIFTATGAQEEITLDLSSLTEAQRDALNLIVIFNHINTQAGTLVLHGWAYDNIIPKLTTPFGVVVQPTQIVWGAIPEATGFAVYIDGVVGSPFAVAAGNYFFNLEALALEPGTYSITIKALGDGVNYSDSELTGAFEYIVSAGPTQLATPFGIVINEGILMWGAQLDASSFEVNITGYASSPVVVAGGTYSLDLTTLGLTTGTYDITIVAIGDGVDFTDSEVSTVVQYVVA